MGHAGHVCRFHPYRSGNGALVDKPEDMSHSSQLKRYKDLYQIIKIIPHSLTQFQSDESSPTNPAPIFDALEPSLL